MWDIMMFKRFTKNTLNKEHTQKTTNSDSNTSMRQIPRNKTYSSEHKFPSFLTSQQEEFSIPPRILHNAEENRNYPTQTDHQPKSKLFDIKEQPTHEHSPSLEEPETTLGEGVSFKGELEFKHFICINGSYEGSLISEGKISVGPKGKIKANITLKEAIIEGFVEGNITADRIELRGEAKIHGDIIAKSLSVDEGVSIIGQVMVTPNESTEVAEDIIEEEQKAV